MISLTPKNKTNHYLEKILNSEQRIEKLLVKSQYTKDQKHQKSDGNISFKFIKSYIREKIYEKYNNLSQASTPYIPRDSSLPKIRIKAKSIHHPVHIDSYNLSKHINHSSSSISSPLVALKSPNRLNIREKSTSRIPKISIRRVHPSPYKSVKFSPNPTN